MITLTNGKVFDEEKFEQELNNRGYKLAALRQTFKNGSIMTSVSVNFDPDGTTGTIVCPNFYLENFPDEILYDYPRLVDEFKLLVDKYGHEKEVEDFANNISNITPEQFYKNVEIVAQKHSDEDIIKKRYCDLDAVVKYKINDCMSMKVTNELINNLLGKGITADETWKHAEENTFNDDQFKISGIYDVMVKMLKENGTSDETIQKMMGQDSVNSQMYIVSNKSYVYGFTQIFNYKAMQKWMNANNIKNIYVIPSSVHEAIILDADTPEIQDEGAFNSMINEVNHTQLAPQDILSDHVYYMNAETCILSLTR